ncbi:hypothetical protein BC936DRAFT_146936 [Jimgerdemannia flammicorona]|uniref:Uncharacterized protein n=1 Tax=Jimgerdemannia flammicorona TaxID=994334 RepID=A0A433D6I1_9FUNG|nr:hypothetical protein BC936DRAFT_146936 [Jimgerdemannia flammicorona]
MRLACWAAHLWVGWAGILSPVGGLVIFGISEIFGGWCLVYGGRLVGVGCLVGRLRFDGGGGDGGGGDGGGGDGVVAHVLSSSLTELSSNPAISRGGDGGGGDGGGGDGGGGDGGGGDGGSGGAEGREEFV